VTPAHRSDLVRQLALDAGFDLAGIARARPVAHIDYFDDWLAGGCAGEMHYLNRHRHLRTDPASLLPGARSVIVVADNYYHAAGAGSMPNPRRADSTATRDDRPRGRIARYAWGLDYHRVLRKKLHQLARRLHKVMDDSLQTRVCVDTAPIMERELAAAAGIGWIGKNTMVIHAELGSFFFLGEIITTLELAPSGPAADHCGSCTRCLDACPTGALIAPHKMDARRCIAYLTIEHRSDIPAELQRLTGDWVFGCDLCQEVCPYNRNPPTTSEPAYELGGRNPFPPRPLLVELMNLSAEQYRQHLSGSAMKRATLGMLRRNAAIAHRNSRTAAIHCRNGVPRQGKGDATG